MSDLLKEAPSLPPEDQRLVEAYRRFGRLSDDLPYSPDFQDFVTALRTAGDTRPEHEIVQQLFRLRKAGRLPRVGRPTVQTADLPAEDIELAEELIKRDLGTLGSRDQLPYTSKFDQLWAEYNQRASRKLTEHQFWKLVTRVSK